MEGFQFSAWAESPGHSAGGYICMDSCLHVYAGVSYIENIFFGCLCYLQDIVYDGGIGFYVYPFTLAKDSDDCLLYTSDAADE